MVFKARVVENSVVGCVFIAYERERGVTPLHDVVGSSQSAVQSVPPAFEFWNRYGTYPGGNRPSTRPAANCTTKQ